MSVSAQNVPPSKGAAWTGRIISVLVIMFLLFDAVMKVLKVAAVVNGTVQAGYPTELVRPIGIILLICIVFYAIPQTSILGAILMTGYLGGATATVVRQLNPLFWMPVVLGMLAWLGIFLRDERLRSLIPLRSPR